MDERTLRLQSRILCHSEGGPASWCYNGTRTCEVIVHQQSATPQMPYWLQMQSPVRHATVLKHSSTIADHIFFRRTRKLARNCTGGLIGILLSRIKMADISTTCSLALGDLGFIFLEHGLMIGEVVGHVMYLKTGCIWLQYSCDSICQGRR